MKNRNRRHHANTIGPHGASYRRRKPSVPAMTAWRAVLPINFGGPPAAAEAESDPALTSHPDDTEAAEPKLEDAAAKRAGSSNKEARVALGAFPSATPSQD